jgi:hypothetical protein
MSQAATPYTMAVSRLLGQLELDANPITATLGTLVFDVVDTLRLSSNLASSRLFTVFN